MKTFVADVLLTKLEEIGSPSESTGPKRRKKVHLTPRKSHTEAVFSTVTPPAAPESKRAQNLSKDISSSSDDPD